MSVNSNIKHVFENSDNPFNKTSNPLFSEYIHLSKYSRWLENEKRRETWPDSLSRWYEFWSDHLDSMDISDSNRKKLKNDLVTAVEHIYNLQTMPSMRSLMTAGKALVRDNVAGYNCAYLAVDDPRAFDETMYILMVGTGVGFSVERQFINKLPTVAEEFYSSDTVIKVRDSRIGWASAYRELISLLYAGKIPEWDTSKIRPKGEILKTFGGQASGPEPLNRLFQFTIQTFKNAAGRQLNSIECHDLMTSVGDCVVSGGVRRSALISLSNLSDDRMRNAKTGQWYVHHPNRGLANNSAVYTEKPDFEVFLDEWASLYKSKSGERGIFSRVAAQNQAKKNGRRDHTQIQGTNPCSEILLRSCQFCNLSEVVVRPEDKQSDIKAKIEVATIIGTLQSTLTDFRYLRRIWRKNTEEERLLGVSLTGVMDHPVLRQPTDKSVEWLESFRSTAVEVNKKYAKMLGINQAAAITCNKPSGTVSSLVDSASGIHPRFDQYYLRTVRANKTEPIAQYMIDKGFYYEEDAMKPDQGYVFFFPMKAPKESICADKVGAIDQLKVWELYNDHYCEHKPSLTAYYTDDEFFEVGQYIWNNFEKLTGVSFLPYSDHAYVQAPFISITKEEYEKWMKAMPDTDFSELSSYESEDHTEGSREFACTADGCSIL